MASEGEVDQNAALRNFLESVAGGDIQFTGGSADNMAQLLAAVIAQAGQNILSAQSNASQLPESEPETSPSGEAAAGPNSNNFEINPQESALEDYPVTPAPPDENAHVSVAVEAPPPEKPKPICIKFPIELRKQIIGKRKEGKKSKDIARELGVSVSGVQKVWERFLATGMVHDRKPSTYAGRPRKYVYSQDTPISPTGFDTQLLDSNVEIFHSSSAHIEYVTPPGSTPLDGTTSAVVIADDGEVFAEAPMDVPGATVEVIATPSLSIARQKPSKKKGAPAYREQLLLRLVDGCPLASMRELPEADSNPHVLNLTASIHRPLYMEYVLGHPFGKVPSPKAFEGSSKEASVILTDPRNPVGKELLAALGYSTKVYFNACCQPSPLFARGKLLSSLPLSLGPGHLVETMRAVLQLLLDLCADPVAALARIIPGGGPALVARNQEGVVDSRGFPPPSKLSEFWQQLYHWASLLQCCENFLSATTPSAPCLLCHPFESFAQTLEIRDEAGEPLSPSSTTPPPSPPRPAPQEAIEVQVLQSGGATPPHQERLQYDDPRAQVEIVEDDGQFEVPVPEQQEAPLQDATVLAPSESHTAASLSETQPEATQTQTTAVSKVQAPSLQPLSQALTEQQDEASPHAKQPAMDSLQDIQSILTAAETIARSASPPTHARSSERLPSPREAVKSSVRGEEQREDEAASGMAQRSRRSKRKGPTKRLSGKLPSPASHLARQDSPRTRSGASRGGKRAEKVGPSPSPPPAKRTRRATQRSAKHPSEWGVEEVAEFISATPHCSYTDVFKEHEVDGESLLSLDPEMMVRLMDIKTGPALHIHKKIVALKKRFGLSTSKQQ